MKPSFITILSRALPFHGIGGMEMVVWDLSRELVRLGYPVRLVTTSLPNSNGEFEQDGVRVVPLPQSPSGRYSPAWWKESCMYFERHCIDSTSVVLSVSAAAFGLLPIKHLVPDIKFVMQAHGTSLGEIISKIRSRNLRSILSTVRNLIWLPKDLAAYHRMDAVIAVGERVHQDLKKIPIRWALEEKKVHLITNGIDTSVFRPDSAARKTLRSSWGIKERTPVVISASRLHAQKGLKNCIRAFANLLKKLPDAVYFIAGEGQERQALQKLAHELGIMHRIYFIGALDRMDLVDYLCAADVFLFLSEHVEGLPLNVLEALSCGLPTIVSAHLDLFPSDAIHMLPPRDAQSVGDCLFFLLTEKTRNRHNRLPSQFVLEYSARQYIAFLSSICSLSK